MGHWQEHADGERQQVQYLPDILIMLPATLTELIVYVTYTIDACCQYAVRELLATLCEKCGRQAQWLSMAHACC